MQSNETFEAKSHVAHRWQSPSHIFVVIRNLTHLRVAYDDDFASAVMRALRFRAHAWGGSVSIVADESFLLHVGQGFSADQVAAQQELERWLLILMGEAIEHEGVSIIPVLSVGFIQVNEFGLPTPSDINQLAAMPEVPQAQIQHTTAWRLAYDRDMCLADNFYRQMSRGHYALAFQPVVSVRDRKKVFYHEGLLRSVGEPLLGENPFAPRLIEALERLGLMRHLDRSIVLTVIEALRNNPSLQFGCNISAQSAVLDVWWSTILKILASEPSIAARLTIEITESASLPDTNAAVEFVHQLRGFGCRVAIDDFGSGFSTLDFIYRAKPDIVKIDQSFLKRARTNGTGSDVLTHLVRLCATLAPHVVVEGVENRLDMTLVEMTGDIWAQGYFLGSPKLSSPDCGLGPISVLADPVGQCVFEALYSS
ncbi:EAL domain-containing protein [Pseudomonas veronii]